MALTVGGCGVGVAFNHRWAMAKAKFTKIASLLLAHCPAYRCVVFIVLIPFLPREGIVIFTYLKKIVAML